MTKIHLKEKYQPVSKLAYLNFTFLELVHELIAKSLEMKNILAQCYTTGFYVNDYARNPSCPNMVFLGFLSQLMV
jgi:hypothetical protein